MLRIRSLLLAGLLGLLGLALAGCHATTAASPAPAAPSSAHAAAATVSPSLSIPGTHKSTTVYQISSPVSTVVVISHAGNVTVTGGSWPVELVCGVAYVVQVPRDVTLRANAGAGAIRLSGLAGDVTAKADVGFISATGLTGASVSLTTGVGGITATFASTPAVVQALTRVGAITLRVPGGASYKVSAHAHLGKATVSVPQSSSSGHA